MTFGKRLKDARTAKKMTQKRLAEIIDVKHNSISNWENDINKPDPDTIELLCGVLEITPNYLLSTSLEEFSPAEKLLIRRYRNLDATGQQHIDVVIDWECDRLEILKERSEQISIKEKPPTRIIQYYQRLASAGTGQVVFGNMPVDRIEIPDKPEYKRVSYAIGVNGFSMEPLYNDMDILLIEPTCEIGVGEIGIFIVGNEAYVKKLGHGELISLNKGYVNIPLTEYSKCMGRVVDSISRENDELNAMRDYAYEQLFKDFDFGENAEKSIG